MEGIKQVRHHHISALLSAWRYLLSDPLKWVLLCFFQPARFHKDYEQLSFGLRVVCSLRMLLSLLLLSEALAILTLPITLLFEAYYFSQLPPTPSDLLTSVIELVPWIAQHAALGVGVGFLLGMAFGELGVGVILAIALGAAGISAGDVHLGFINGIGFACALGLTGGTGRGFKWGIIPWGLVASLVGGACWTIFSLATIEVAGSITQGIQVTAVFFASYVIGSSRLLLYIASGPSGWRTYRKSRNNPEQVFVYLRHSSLHWDEHILLSLPCLRRTLRIAMGQNVAQTLKELTFIICERPAQRDAALQVLSEIALHDMQMCEIIHDIASAHQRLDELWTQEIKHAASRWHTPFMHLGDAAREIEKYYHNLNWHIRLDGLEQALMHLENIYLNMAFPDAKLNADLAQVVMQWRHIIRLKKEELEQGDNGVGQIRNPYIAGDALKAQDALFVGRRDVVQQLSESLSDKKSRPTFLLSGERRMGKSSTLRQLPHLLGASYIPVFYDLQYRKPSSIDAFLYSLAQEIYKMLNLRGIQVEPLERNHLMAALRRNEASVYQPFDAWLDRLEDLLKREDRTLLLLIDEFEKLEEAKEKYLDLELLLDWFRGTIQNRIHVALLFSGVQTVTELGAHWASRFVNVKALKLSFLRPAEALDLITRPVPQDVFGEGVVEEIMRVTICHPFLVQAVCAALIHELNMGHRNHAEIADVAAAVSEVLEAWDGYFLDQWDRTDPHQRSCLALLLDGEEKDFSTLLHQSSLDQHMLRQALQTLCKRDLTVLEHGYHIATPIFHLWLERNI